MMAFSSGQLWESSRSKVSRVFLCQPLCDSLQYFQQTISKNSKKSLRKPTRWGDKSFRQRGHSLVVKRYPSKLDMRVRFPLPAPIASNPTDQQIEPPMKNIFKSLLMVTALGIASTQAQDEAKTPDSVKRVIKSISADKEDSNVQKVVGTETKKDPNSVCEIVKAAIVTAKASKITVGKIVQAAAAEAPDRLDLIVQCATAAAPDASGNIQAAAASARGTMASSGSNPLNFPGDGSEPVGPQPGTDGGNSIIKPGPQLESPPAIEPPFVTDPNPAPIP